MSLKAEAIKNMEADLIKFEKEIFELQKTLEVEEKQLEVIIDGLKGKTDSFQAQLEEKQMELAPWTEKINDQVSQIKVFQSERDLLNEKIHSNENAMKTIKSKLTDISQSFNVKVCFSLTLEG